MNRILLLKIAILSFFGYSIIGCAENKKKERSSTPPEVKISGAMKNVMRKGQLQGTILLDTISNKTGLYGLGPVAYLKGEILVNNGNSYVATVTSDTTMSVTKNSTISAPFFVYANATDWTTITVPDTIKNSKALEHFIDTISTTYKRPFPFKLEGTVNNATIHVQNLPDGTKVASRADAHKGQVTYPISNKAVTIVGFFSTEHQAVFTHHDSYVHMHLITKDEKQMGHLDAIEIDALTLYVPKQ
ncbi:acetolactate decarboxylase [Neptunitalea lumnitzerae]|uniref:Alpha-acetolactate decarboxylase n=1 Tax=Neptunitalea lumnitzerae TaxID=2965509 RepID=A0ABQ5MM62_9FLAO|nr:acetolactate decarboxylase [Neptunitalea sp. Y10]GLB50437.1 hypothetical protein Y10_28050 [Neptunitalea sp. Y10]